LIEFKEEPGLFGFLEIEEYLSKILKRKVDLVIKNSLKPYMGKQILKEVIYILKENNKNKNEKLF